MSDVFQSVYADLYDSLYLEKDYAAECDLIEKVFQGFAADPVRTVLDLGCGTGSHAIPLAARGYEVVGVDRSAEMLAHAQKKENADRVRFEIGDVRSVDLKKTFDAALMMFAVLGYQLENEDVLAALKTVRKHLSPGGIFMFDVWYGPAVLHQRPSQRVKVIPTATGQILRVADGALDILKHQCTVEYRIWRLESERQVANSRESHTMRYFFPLELKLFLEIAGFNLLQLTPFPYLDQEPAEDSWNVLALAQAI